MYCLRALKGVNFPVLHGVTYFFTSLAIDRLSLRRVNLRRAVFIGALAAVTTLSFGISGVNLDNIEQATRCECFRLQAENRVLNVLVAGSGSSLTWKS